MTNLTPAEQRKIDAACDALGLEATVAPDSTGRSVVWFHSEGRKRAVLTIFEIFAFRDLPSVVRHRQRLFETLAAVLAEVVRLEGASWLYRKADPPTLREIEARIGYALQHCYDDEIRGALLCYRVALILDPVRHALEVTIEPR